MDITYREYVKTEIVRLRTDYPLASADERRAALGNPEERWIAMLFNLPRTAIVPLNVGRSLVGRIGHKEASRMLRHVANFPACLPTVARSRVSA